jgi:hypothetical protein
MSDQTSGAHRREREPLDRVFDVLSHPLRRRLLTSIAESTSGDGAAVTTADLNTRGEDVDRLRVELYHAHLPKLAEAGYIEWDGDTRATRRGPNFDEVEPVLRLLADEQDDLPGAWP